MVSIATYPSQYYGLAAERTYRVIYNNVPDNICLGFVTDTQGGFFQITVDGVDVKKSFDDLEFSPAIAAQACSKKINNITYLGQ